MFSYGEDFDYDTDVADLIAQYIRALQSAGGRKGERSPVYENSRAEQRSKERMQAGPICSEAQAGFLPYKKPEMEELFESNYSQLADKLSPDGKRIMDAVYTTLYDEDYELSPLYANEVDDEYLSGQIEAVKELLPEELKAAAESAVLFTVYGMMRPGRWI